MRRKRICLVRIAGLTLALVFGALNLSAQDLDTALMNSTFEIVGHTATGQRTTATVFIIGRPVPGDKDGYDYVLVTAAHVFNEMSGDAATIMLRRKVGEGSYEVVPVQLPIRKLGHNLYTVNPAADVVAMYVSLPDWALDELIPMSLLADDSRLESLNIHPGDQLSCLGFPLDVNVEGFPVIRTGLLASYPLTPSARIGKFYYTFHVFPGNSGGPVFFNYVARGAQTNIIVSPNMSGIIGLVSQQLNSTDPKYANANLDIAVMVPSTIIRATIEMLPPGASH